MKKIVSTSAVVSCVGLIAACTLAPHEEGEVSLSPELDNLDTEQIVTSVNADGTWTAEALPPIQIRAGTPFTSQGKATFTGPAGKTRAMGVCFLRRGWTGTWSPTSPGVPCNTVDDCNNAPTSIPSGGSRYCTWQDGSGTGQKYCFYRPGTSTLWCAGSPQMPWVDEYGNTCTPSGPPSPSCHPQPVSPGTYLTPPRSATPEFSRWISYACFEGCAATDPSSSSSTTIVQTCTMCGAQCCH